MYLKLLITGLSLLCMSCGVLAVKRENKNPPFMWPDTVYDIYSQSSGDGPIITDDEDLVDGSGDGSGSGDGKVDTEITTLKPTVALTACQRDQLNATSDADKTRCTESGQYEKLQCGMKRKKKECWCVDLTNTEITGTRMKYPTEPDCENGKNLKLCVTQLLKKRHGLLGVYEPHCTFEGEFEKIQCHGAACWCVDAQGLEQLGTRVYKPAVPKCKEPTTSTERPTTPARRPVYTKVMTLEPTYKPIAPIGTKRPTHGDKDKKINNKETFLPEDDDIKPDDKDDDDDDDDNDTDNDDDNTDLMGKPQKQSLSLFNQIMAKPGLLAAVIGGAVVGLLCAILLVMFIVYRMRKKDEGSYPLDEQKFTNYSYMKANDKEFYA